MNETQFDHLTRAMRAGVSRRGMLRALTGGGLAFGLLGWTAAPDAAAKSCKKIKDKKKRKACLKKAKGATQLLPAASPPPPAGDPPPSPLVCGSGGPCRVFLSSTRHDGNLGGLSGADAICQGLAKDANLPGTYAAWLSDSTGSPSARFTPSTGPYRLVTGTTIAANFTDLTDGRLAAPISVTETGVGVEGEPVAWTHTRGNGTPGGFGDVNCVNWSTNRGTGVSGNFGLATSKDATWTDTGSSFCDVRSHLYCFEQVTCPADTTPVAGRCAPNCGVSCEAKAGATCGASFDGNLFCAPIIESCASLPTICSSHADCGAQELCALTGCGSNNTNGNRCHPFLA